MNKTIYPVGNYSLHGNVKMVSAYSIMPLSVSIGDNREAVVIYRIGKLGDQIEERTSNGRVQLNKGRNGFEIVVNIMGVRLHFPFSI